MALPLEKLGSTHPPRTALIDPERAKQYAAATNDPNPAYEAAMCSQSVIATVAGDDAGLLRRLAVRFGGNVFPGNHVVTEIYDADGVVPPSVDGVSVYVFEAISQGAVVVRNGLAEVL